MKEERGKNGALSCRMPTDGIQSFEIVEGNLKQENTDKHIFSSIA